MARRMVMGVNARELVDRVTRVCGAPAVLGRQIHMTMTEQKQKIVKYLHEARATEAGLVRVLQSQIAMAPRGSYRTALERHLGETRDHAHRIEERLDQLGHGGSRVQAGIGAAQTVFAQALAVGKLPVDLLRGSGAEEKTLKNAKDAASTEALEIATYTAIEQLARDAGDEETAKLAASIRADEQRMLDRVLAEIPKLTDAVAAGGPAEVKTIGAADKTRKAARKTTSAAKRAAGTARGAVAREQDLPIAGYDKLSAEEITGRLPQLSQDELAQVAGYERRKANRTTILSRIEVLSADEPWTGYDGQTVEEIRSALEKGDEATVRAVRDYERAHKQRAGVIEAAERELANA
jgi:ferritin-like metal-binding protein YciE